MRAFAIAVAVAVGFSMASPGHAADLGGIPTTRLGVGSSPGDGPYYITPSGDGFYKECGRPTEGVSGPPNPNSMFFGPVGYRCFHGTYAYDPFIPPRCKFGFVQEPQGWVRVRRCH